MNTKAAYPPVFFVAMAATMLLFFSFQPLLPVFPLYVGAIGGSPADNGLATWVFAAAALISRPLAGVLTDRWGRKPVLVLGALLFGGGSPLYALVSGMPVLLAVRVVHGVGMALFSTAYQAFTADLLSPERYGEGLGLANVASMVPMVVGPLFGEYVAQACGFRTLFLTLGLVGGVGLTVTLALPGGTPVDLAASLRTRERAADPVSPPVSGPSSPWRTLREPGVRAGAVGMAVLGVPFGAFISFLPMMADARGLGATGWVFAAYALAASVAQPLVGRVADRWGNLQTALVGLALVGVSAAGLAAAGQVWTLIGLAGLYGVGHGAAGSDVRGSAAAIQYTAFDLLVGLGSWGLGLLATATDYGVVYGTVSGVVLLGVLAGALLVVKTCQV
jgi:MFS family permease